MKIIYLILALLSCSSLFTFAQTTGCFERQEQNNSIYLYPESSTKLDRQSQSEQKKDILYIGNQEKLVEDVKLLMQNEFRSISDEELVSLKRVLWNVRVNGDGRCESVFFRVPKESLQNLPNWEAHLYRLTQEIEKLDFSTYKLIYANPENKSNHIGYFTFPLSWVHK